MSSDYRPQLILQAINAAEQLIAPAASVSDRRAYSLENAVLAVRDLFFLAQEEADAVRRVVARKHPDA